MRPAHRAAFLIRSRAILWLALCVFGLKALVPQGFMLSGEPATTLIQLCSAAGPLWVQGPAKAEHADPSSHQDTQHAEQSAVCPAGAVLAAAPLVPSHPPPKFASPSILSAAARAPPPFADATPLAAPLGARAPPFSFG